MEDAGYPPKLDSQSEPFQTAVRDLRKIILCEMDKLLTRLLVSPIFPSFYRDYTGKLDYRTFEKKLMQGLEETKAKETQGEEPFWPLVLSEMISPELDQVNSRQEQEHVFPQVLPLLLSPGYSPPTEWQDIVTHLACLFVSWNLNLRTNLLKDFSPLGDIMLLLSFCKLMGASYEIFANFTMKGERELKRTKKSTKTKKENTDKIKQ